MRTQEADRGVRVRAERPTLLDDCGLVHCVRFETPAENIVAHHVDAAAMVRDLRAAEIDFVATDIWMTLDEFESIPPL